MSVGLQENRTGGKGKLRACTAGRGRARLYSKQVPGFRSGHAHRKKSHRKGKWPAQEVCSVYFPCILLKLKVLPEREKKFDARSIPLRGKVTVGTNRPEATPRALALDTASVRVKPGKTP